MTDTAEIRDAFMLARAKINDALMTAYTRFFAPDMELQIRLQSLQLPPEVEALLDEDTKQKIVEVLHGKKNNRRLV